MFYCYCLSIYVPKLNNTRNNNLFLAKKGIKRRGSVINSKHPKPLCAHKVQVLLSQVGSNWPYLHITQRVLNNYNADNYGVTVSYFKFSHLSNVDYRGVKLRGVKLKERIISRECRFWDFLGENASFKLLYRVFSQSNWKINDLEKFTYCGNEPWRIWEIRERAGTNDDKWKKKNRFPFPFRFSSKLTLLIT